MNQGVTKRVDAPISEVSARAYQVPTETPESDGTLSWDSTTIVIAFVSAGGMRGLGYSYADASCTEVINKKLARVLRERDALNIPSAWMAMRRATRNLGPAGLAAMAVSAVDNALWDLKGKLLGVSTSLLLGHCRETVLGYGSGGFTSYTLPQLQEHCAAWIARSYRRVKIKVGTDPKNDPARVAAVRKAVGPEVEIFVDGNGAYGRKRALDLAWRFHQEFGVTWFEEPVSSEDLDGLRLIRDQGPPGLDIAAGEYGYSPAYFAAMVHHGAVDVLQADATRCGGISGFLIAAAICEANGIPLSAHCAPALHVHPGVAAPAVRHLECFYDHVRIEDLFFDGSPIPQGGELKPNCSRPGLGLELKEKDVEQFAV